MSVPCSGSVLIRSLCERISGQRELRYASTAEILNRALTRYGRQLGCRKTVEVEMGELLKIDRRGHITRATFDASKLCRPSWEYWGSSLYAEPPKMESEHIRLLKSVARAFGFTGEMID